jgi:cellobiose phosphorylase
MADADRVAESEFGYFDVPAREYVITSPSTPAPWHNYLGLEGVLCGIISNTAGGTTWYRDPLACRITRYMQVGAYKGRPGRYLYVRDNESGAFWSATYQPVAHVKPDGYECRHGLGYTRIISGNQGITSELLHLIPLGALVEIQRVRVSNDSGRPRRLSCFTYREFINSSADHDLFNVQFSGHIAQMDPDPDDARILYVTTSQTPPERARYMAVSEEPAGFDTKQDAFIGDGSLGDPQAVREGRTSGSLCGDDTAVGVFQLDLELEPGQQKVFHVLVGWPPQEGHPRDAVAEWLGEDARVMKALEDLKDYAVGLLGTYQCEVDDAHMGVAVNNWNAYQCWINFQFSRSISGYACGLRRSMGTRDSLQDLLGYMHMSPDGARRRILELMGAVHLEDGSCRHQYSALTGEGSENLGFSDDHLWAVLAVANYVKETGDLGILDEELSYSDNSELSEDLYGHLLRAVKYSFDDRGAHGIPRLRSADWNDTIGEGPDDEVSESVLVGMMLVHMARLMGPLTQRSGREGLTVEHGGEQVNVLDYYRTVAETMTETLNREAWLEDGWYARGTDREGEWFGVPSRDEAKIFLEPQPWSVMAGVADEERGRTAMDSVREHLFTENGIEILTPACTVAPSGNFTVFPKGAKENGGIFCHPNPWAMCAECILGRGDRAFEYYGAILPPKASEADPRHYTAEPYVYGQLRYARPHREFGKAAGTWLTGTAAWNYVAATQYILGVRPDWDGLIVDPCVPADWAEFRVTRTWRAATYDISISKPDGVMKGVRSVTLDGEPLEGNLLPALGDGRVHDVRVVMG